MFPLIILAILGAILMFLTSGLFVVKQQTVAVVERFGKFKRVHGPGLHWRIPFVDQLAGRPSLRIQQLDLQVETKTSDNVFVLTTVSVQYHVLPDEVVAAFYRLDNPERQITSYVFDQVRAEIPKLELDAVFARKDDVAVACFPLPPSRLWPGRSPVEILAAHRQRGAARRTDPRPRLPTGP